MIIGITGRIGTGKTTLAGIFEKRGFLRIDADEIYHNLRVSSPEMNDEIKTRLGTLDNKEILDLIKDDKSAHMELNDITHKFVIDEIDNIILNNDEKGIVLDVPVPVKRGFLDTAEFVIVTDCSIAEQIERIMKRDGLTKVEAEGKVSIQSDSKFYSSLGDYVINTEHMGANDLEILADKVIFGKYLLD